MHLAVAHSLLQSHLGHHVSQRLDLLIKVLQLLCDHGPMWNTICTNVCAQSSEAIILMEMETVGRGI